MHERPNILFIMSDQHAPDWLGGLDHPHLRTPHLDRLMARGVTFRKAYSAYPMCTPSRASFMTGRLTPEHGVWELGAPLSTGCPTWVHVLRRAGYCTSISGRMHFVGPDDRHGFERRVYPELSDSKLKIPFTYGSWEAPQNDDHLMVGAVTDAGPLAEPNSLEIYDRDVTAAAIDELTELAAQDRPWALTVGMILPHIPYKIHQPYFDLYDDDEIAMPRPAPDGRTWEELVPPTLEDNRKWLGLTSDGATDADVRRARRAYYGMITCLDELVGQLVAKLEDLGIADRTWIVYASDHGDNMGEHGFWSKLNFYEDSVRVPLIIAPPGCPCPGAQCQAPVSLVDWMSTMLDLTGERIPGESLPGRSLLPLLEDPSMTWDQRPVLADYACDGTRVPMRMVRRGRWKAWFAPGFPPALFDLETDPGEFHDLGQAADHQPILTMLRTIAEADGYDGEALIHQVHQLKRRLTYIDNAERPASS